MLSWLFGTEKKEDSPSFWKEKAEHYEKCFHSTCELWDKARADCRALHEESKFQKEQIAILQSEFIKAKSCTAGFNAYEEMTRINEESKKLAARGEDQGSRATKKCNEILSSLNKKDRKKPGNKPGQKWTAARREAYWAKKVKVGSKNDKP